MIVRELVDTLTMLCNEHGMAEREVIVWFGHECGGDKSRVVSVGAQGEAVYIYGGNERHG